MLQRPEDEVLNPNPDYDDRSCLITVTAHYGGMFVNGNDGKVKYVGGRICKWDYYNFNELDSLTVLEGFADLLSIGPFRRFFRHSRGHGFTQLCDNSAVYDLAVDSTYSRATDFWIEGPIVARPETVSNGLDDEEKRYAADKMKGAAGKVKLSADEYRNKLKQEKLEREHGKAAAEPNYKGIHIVDKALNGDSASESDSEPDVVGCSSDEFDSSLDSDIETELHGRNADRVPRPFHHENNNYDPKFALGMTFATKDEFRLAVHSYGVQVLRNTRVVKNDKTRMYAKCKESTECTWRVHCHKSHEGPGFVVHTYEPEHSCGFSEKIGCGNSKWLAERFLSMFKIDPEKKAKVFVVEVKKETGMEISIHQAYRAKRKALAMLEGDPEAQYGMLWDYAEELRKCNPGSTIICDVNRDTNMFEQMYVCFKALKDGFMIGCRPIISLDGCHLSGPHSGVLLTALGVDPNNKPFPIAYAVVTHEAGDTWGWFLGLLKHDLNIVNPEDFTFISDKQKGLIKAVCDIFPGAKHRFCVIHLLKNFWSHGFRGDGLKYALYRASNATTEGHFNKAMEEIKALDVNAYKWLQTKPPEQWSKSHFDTYPKCDLTQNNTAECFNSMIVLARSKPILTMLEWIRECLMKRMQENRDRAKAKWKGRFCPRIMHLLEKNASRVRDCGVKKADDTHYVVYGFNNDQYNVDLGEQTCTCRRWQLSGIPCKHAIAAIRKAGLNYKEYVHSCYTVQNYHDVYEGAVYGINGRLLWGNTFYIPPLPPQSRKTRGRRGSKRRLGDDEADNNKKKKKGPVKMKRDQSTIHCGYCTTAGHNITNCKQRMRDEKGFGSSEDDEHNDEFAEFFMREREAQAAREVHSPNDSPPREPTLGEEFENLRNRRIVPDVINLDDDFPIATQQTQNERDYVQGPTNHEQLLQSKAAFAKVSKAHGSTISGLKAPTLAESQSDPTIGPRFVQGGKKWVHLNSIGGTVKKDTYVAVKKEKIEEMKKAKKSKSKKK